MSIRFDGRVAIVTGAGVGLGRSHALGLAKLGAKVVVNDLGVATDGTGSSSAQAEAVVKEIEAMGGEAMAHGANVTDAAQVKDMVDQAIAKWGKVDILVCNAGILRDKTFAKMELEDFAKVVDVHLMGSVVPTKALWDHFRENEYGRIVYTTSASGLYGNFGQSNYGAAKMALVGLMQTLSLEGARYDIRVNCIAPTAATQMLDGLLPQAELDHLRPEFVSPGVLHLLTPDAPNRTILCAGAGGFATANITLTEGSFVSTGPNAPEDLARLWPKVTDRSGESIPASGEAQGRQELAHAGYARRA